MPCNKVVSPVELDRGVSLLGPSDGNRDSCWVNGSLCTHVDSIDVPHINGTALPDDKVALSVPDHVRDTLIARADENREAVRIEHGTVRGEAGAPDVARACRISLRPDHEGSRAVRGRANVDLFGPCSTTRIDDRRVRDA